MIVVSVVLQSNYLFGYRLRRVMWNIASLRHLALQFARFTLCTTLDLHGVVVFGSVQTPTHRVTLPDFILRWSHPQQSQTGSYGSLLLISYVQTHIQCLRVRLL